MVLIKVPENREQEFLEKFFMESAFTFVGLNTADVKGLKQLEKDVKNAGYTGKDVVMYYFHGDVMNKHYHLTGDNAYNKELTFVVIPDFYNPLFKLAVSARWFDDIVQNDLEREAEKC